MEKKEMKDNILRNCYYQRNEYVGKETLESLQAMSLY